MRAIETTTKLPMEAAEAAVREALTSQGFGVLTEIDLAATLKARLSSQSRTATDVLTRTKPRQF